MAYGDEISSATIAHEIGHNHGRDHAPCGVQGDRAYPYEGGSIGVWGFDRRNDELKDPAQVADIMGYCTPQWVSDYTYRAFLERIALVNGVMAAEQQSTVVPQPWRVALASPNGLRWGHPIGIPQPPAGRAEEATVLDSLGSPIAAVGIFVVRTSLPGHETILVPEPEPGWAAVELAGRGALAFGGQ